MLLIFCLIFCQFQPGVAYKSVAYKKKRVVWHNSCFCQVAISSELLLFWNSKFFRPVISPQQLFFHNINFFRAKLLPSRYLLRIDSSLEQLLFGGRTCYASAKLRALRALTPTYFTHHWYAPYSPARLYTLPIINTCLRACAPLLSPTNILRAFFCLSLLLQL